MNSQTSRIWKLFLLFSPVFVILLLGFIFVGLFFFILAGEDHEQGFYSGGKISAIGEKEIPAEYIPIYLAAEAEYGVPWNLLAAIHRVETRFSTIENMVSPVGAIGHVQVMKCTFVGWNYPGCSGLGNLDIPDRDLMDPTIISQYGGYGVDANQDGKADPWDLEDAIFSAAHMLASNGVAEGNFQKAIFTYNHSEQYVAEVMKYAQLYVEEGFETFHMVQVSEGGLARPLLTAITSDFGERIDPFSGKLDFHAGIDFDCSAGETIPASQSGKVVYAGWQNETNPKQGYGLYVWVDHGNGVKTTYAHLSSVSVEVGDVIQLGDVVGQCGSTGSSTGSHLHFEVFVNGQRVNPARFIGLK